MRQYTRRTAEQRRKLKQQLHAKLMTRLKRREAKVQAIENGNILLRQKIQKLQDSMFKTNNA